jgi:cephalosporin hydroxylase
MALLYFTRVPTCSTIAEAMAKASNDRRTRMLHGAWPGHTLLDAALRTLFTVAGGYLIVDDTVVEKTYAQHKEQEHIAIAPEQRTMAV